VSWLRSAVRCIVLFAAGAASLIAVAQAPPAADDGTGAYILVLQEGYSAPPGESKRKEPDVAKHGGHVVRSHGKERFIRLPRAAAQALCAEEGVLYLQRVWQGESLESEGEPPCGPKPQSAGAEIRTNTGTGPHWETGDYTYDAAGNIRQIGNDLYTYDSAGRLISANVSGTVETYKYDSFGNLVEKSITGQPASPIAVDPSSNRLVGVTYDVAGNVTTDGTRTYTYDAVGMLDYAYDAGPPVRYIYTAADERIATFRNASTYRMTLRDAQGKVVREYEADAFAGPAPWRWVQDYVYADGHAVAAEREAVYHGKRHLHADHLGSIRMVTDATGDHLTEHKYYPFGAEQTSPVQETVEFGFDRPDPARFTGHERDYRWLNADHVDYLDYMHARFYKPAAGRFLSVDPTWESADLGRPQSWNRYAYVTNNPINLIDPDGRAGTKPGASYAIEWEYLGPALGATTIQGIAQVVLEPGPDLGDGELPKDPAERATYLEQHAKLDQPGGPKAGRSGGPGAGRDFSEKTKDTARAQSDNRCVFCGTETTRTPGPNQSNIDHAHPKKHGGSNALENAQNTCRTCNLKKAVKTTLEYLRRIL
jgi:RHS repeat-associated protein